MDHLKVYNPYSQQEIASIPRLSENEVETAIAKAYDLYKNRSRHLAKHERIAILGRLKNLMEEGREDLCRIATTEGGKPWMDSMVEVDRAINGVGLAIDHLSRMHGDEIPMGQTASSTGRMAMTFIEPIGVVSAISAFNHPLNLIVHQVIPAFAVGAPVLIKPASSTPLTCINFHELMIEAGVPADWCQVLITSQQWAEKLVTDHRIAFLSFIGSAEVGWSLRSKLNPGAACALEHGGVAPVIVCEDADPNDILAPILKGGFYHAGQVCVSVQKVFVPEGFAEDFASKLAKATSSLQVGNPLDPKTEVGPLISTAELERVDQWVHDSVAQGAELLCGGRKVSETCYAPTVLLNPPDRADVSKHEVFGPVVCVYSYSSLDQAINTANALPFKFQAAVFTNDINTMFDCVKRIKAKAVMVNDHTAFRVDWMPFGGGETSGIGVGGIPHSMDEMSSKKLMVIKSSSL